MNAEEFENYSLEGGGVKAIAYAGVVQYLDEHKLLQKIKRVSGSSGGALAAVMIACKLDSKIIQTELAAIPFDKLEDDSFGVVRDITRFFREYGIYKGDELEILTGTILKKFVGDENITFKQLYTLTKIELHITGSNVTKGKTEYFSYITEPDMLVKYATRISMSFPFAYSSVVYKGNRYCDGGTYANLPMTIWDKDGKRNMKTLGIALISDEETKKEQHYSTDTLLEYTKAILGQVVDRASNEYYYDEKNKSPSRLIEIKTFDIDTLDFAINNAQKQKLIQSGYESCANFFKTKTKYFSHMCTKSNNNTNNNCCQTH